MVGEYAGKLIGVVTDASGNPLRNEEVTIDIIKKPESANTVLGGKNVTTARAITND